MLLLGQYLVEESLAPRLKTTHPFLVYGPQDSAGTPAEELRVPPGLTFSAFIRRIVPVMDSCCRSLLENSTIMNAVKVSACACMLSAVATTAAIKLIACACMILCSLACSCTKV